MDFRPAFSFGSKWRLRFQFPISTSNLVSTKLENDPEAAESSASELVLTRRKDELEPQTEAEGISRLHPSVSLDLVCGYSRDISEHDLRSIQFIKFDASLRSKMESYTLRRHLDSDSGSFVPQTEAVDSSFEHFCRHERCDGF